MNLDKNIKYYLKKNEMQVQELIEKTQIHPSVMFKILNGTTKDPKISTIIKISKALNISVNTLIGEKNGEK